MYIHVMMVWVMAEATCEVAVVCYHDASIHVNVSGLCASFQVRIVQVLQSISSFLHIVR